MQSRGLAERDIDKMIQNTKRVFNLVRGNISDENCRTIIDSLCKASSGAPDYRRDDITPLLMNAYYHRVILNEKMYP